MDECSFWSRLVEVLSVKRMNFGIVGSDFLEKVPAMRRDGHFGAALNEFICISSFLVP
jgi:hypothetical protein